MRDVLLEYGVATPIHVLPTGLPADCFVAGDGHRFRTQAKIPLERPLMTYIGRVAHEKNIDFLVQVRASENKVPFGFITSEASAAIKELAMNSGASFLITKPFSPEVMQEALSPILGKC